MSLTATVKIVYLRAKASLIWTVTILGSLAFGPLSVGFERLSPFELTSQPAMSSWLVPLMVVGGSLTATGFGRSDTLLRKLGPSARVVVSAAVVSLGALIPGLLALASSQLAGAALPGAIPWALPIKCGCIAALALKVSRPPQAVFALCTSAWLVPQILPGQLSSVLGFALETPQVANLASAAGFLCLGLAAPFVPTKASH